MSALVLRGVEVGYGSVPVLRGVDLTVAAESFTAVLGPSGCGKTTMLRVVAGFLRPDCGTIHIAGQEVAGPDRFVAAQHRGIGYVPQEGALFPHLSVGGNITFGLRRAERRNRDRVAELLELVGMSSGMAARMPHELSGGQQQRVALARALAPTPSLILLDEPFTALDASLREGTRRAVAAALRVARATTVLVTHDQGEALSMADQVAVMRDGLLVQVGTPQQVYESPIDAGVAQFVGEAVLLDAILTDPATGVATSALGPLRIADRVGRPGGGRPDLTLRVLVRPEQIRVLPAGEGAAAVVLGRRYYGHDAAVSLRLDDAHDGVVTARVLGLAAPLPGTRVGLCVVGDVRAVGQ